MKRTKLRFMAESLITLGFEFAQDHPDATKKDLIKKFDRIWEMTERSFEKGEKNHEQTSTDRSNWVF